MIVNTTSIDPVKIQNWAKANRYSLSKISEEMGCSHGFMSRVLQDGYMPTRKYELFKRLFNLVDSDVRPDAPKPLAWRPIKPVEGPGHVEVYHSDQSPYDTHIEVKPDRVCFSVTYGGQILYSAYSRVKGSSELDLMQTISYAARMVYKKAEQRELEK